MRKNAGFTLLELMVSTCIMTLVMGVLMVLGMSMSRALAVQKAQASVQSETAQGMIHVVREVREARADSIPWDSLPATTLQYRVPSDLDGNGYPVDLGGFVELSDVLTVGPDVQDLNRDGLTQTQLVWTDGERVRVLANQLVPNEDANGNGSLDPGEDTNNNGTLDSGVLFERAAEGLRITIRTQQRATPGVPPVTARLSETVAPRNGG